MTLVNKTFHELTATELYEILRVRADVFVVEQNCVYQDLDRTDYVSRHVVLYDGDEIIAYLRIFAENTDTARIGRVLSTKRGKGYGLKCMEEGLKSAKRDFGAASVVIDAQVYAAGFYEKLGFRTISEEFLEDGIPHVKMKVDLN